MFRALPFAVRTVRTTTVRETRRYLQRDPKIGIAEVTPKVRRNNLIVAAVLVSFVGGVYYTAISKMQQQVQITVTITLLPKFLRL